MIISFKSHKKVGLQPLATKYIFICNTRCVFSLRWLLTVNYFRKNAPSKMFYRVLNRTLHFVHFEQILNHREEWNNGNHLQKNSSKFSIKILDQSFNILVKSSISTQPAITGSKLKIEILLTLTYFTPCSSVSIVNLKQVNAGWVDMWICAWGALYKSCPGIVCKRKCKKENTRLTYWFFFIK